VSDFATVQLTIAKNIQYFRKKKEFSQHKLAEESGMSGNYISHLEQGIKSPSLQTLHSIANALGIELYQLFLPITGSFIPKSDLQRIRNEIVREVTEVLDHYASDGQPLS
jgi:transcriptional regulator with XRE-family HTH domain